MAKHTVLFLAANPADTDRLAIDREARAIHEAIERSGHRDRFELVTRWAVEPLDLLRELRKLRPTIVHFSGHGGGDVRGSARGGRASRDIVSAAASDASAPQSGLFFAGRDKPICPSLAHQGPVVSAAFSPDGTRVVTASDDHTAQIWETGLDNTPPKDWPALAARSSFVLINGVHVLRSSFSTSAGAPR